MESMKKLPFKFYAKTPINFYSLQKNSIIKLCITRVIAVSGNSYC